METKHFLQTYSIATLFSTSLRIYKIHFLPIILLTILFLAIPFLVGQFFSLNAESILYFFSVRLFEAATMLGVISIAFHNLFPTFGVISVFRRYLLLSIHIAILQYVVFTFGLFGLFFPFPLNLIVLVLWIFSLFLFVFAQPILIVYQQRGVQALGTSFQIAKSNFRKTFLVILVTTSIQAIAFMIFFQFFLSESVLIDMNSELNLAESLPAILKLPEVQQSLRVAQYFSALLIQPFSSILLCLLFFDLAHKHTALPVDQLHSMANELNPMAVIEASDDTKKTEEDSSTNHDSNYPL